MFGSFQMLWFFSYAVIFWTCAKHLSFITVILKFFLGFIVILYIELYCFWYFITNHYLTFSYSHVQEENLYEIDIPLKFISSVGTRVHGLACWFDVLFDGR